MKKILNKRLQTISAFIKDNEKIIDIGCDHALLGIYLVLNKKNIKVVSSDINSGPLEKAQDNILKYHVEDKIELRLGDGLEVLTDDIETIIISGMGALTIIDILKSINNYPNIKRIILSPNNDFPIVRESLSKQGFKIKQEIMVLENKKYYPVMEYIKGKDNIDFFFGKLDLENGVVKSYYLSLYQKNKSILEKNISEELLMENKLIEDNIINRL